MERDKSSPVLSLIHDVTGGKPFVFMVMPFGAGWHLYEQVKAAVNDSVKLLCIRADDIPGAGFDLLEKIHVAIERAELIIAEISERNANVFYELGYAAGQKKPILLLAQHGVDVPTDLRGRELILHSDKKEAVLTFGEELRNNLRRRMSAQLALLRDMLEAEKALPSFIIASPKYPEQPSVTPGQLRDRRTFGDNLGILGLLSAFGSMFGETAGVELVSGQYCTPELVSRDHNIYAIGSPKVNQVTLELMNMIQARGKHVWRFGPSSGAMEVGDYPLSLYAADERGEREFAGRKAIRDGYDVFVEDFGIILRGPHPRNPSRMLMVLAGVHSLGTGAACLAATRSEYIRKIRDAGIDIADRSLSFWVLVRGIGSKIDGLLDANDVSIEQTGIF